MTHEHYTAFIHAFRETVTQLGRKVAFVVSVDWSHVGRKFGDAMDAADVREEVVELDQRQLAALERCDYAAFRQTVQAGSNATHIDGFSCITTFFDLTAPKSATLLAYRQWHESETSSAVSFASMAFYDSETDSVTDSGEESAVS
jgi:AmmeMemoRadiSam system protein B